MKRVLIANRGEIAIRVMRACAEMGIQTVALYTPADRHSHHIENADLVYPVDNYLNAKLLIAIAKKAGAQAIHPGYGFLAENHAFAASVERAGLIFIGPRPATIIQMGSKTAARKLAERAGVPCVPGTTTPLRNPEDGKKIAARLGYPVLIKAVAGGGGKGMRIVRTPTEFSALYKLARAETLAAFANGDLYIEKLIERPHHVEVQVLGDGHGNIVHLFERECSLQRRHQKIIEEAPSPFISDKTRAAICGAAVLLARAARYRSAGTIEFLVNNKQHFYFLEMNTRIQVEHPITEMITGVDLVKAQIEIAMGRRLPFKQEDLNLHGHAIECRLYAEDPFNNFMPSAGKITALVEPHGPGVRMDTGVVAGSMVPIDYDPILGKLAVWGRTRREAIARMTRALGEYRIAGVRTNLAFHQQVMKTKEFLAGRYETGFVDKHMGKFLGVEEAGLERALAIAAVAAELRDAQQTHVARVQPENSEWLAAARGEGINRGLENRISW